MKFACPNCQQHIEADDAYAGVQIGCPTCKAQMIVPGTPVSHAPAPAPVSAPPSYAPPPQSGLRTQVPAQTPAASGPRPGYQAPAPRQVHAGSGQAKWYANPYLYLGVVFLIFLGLFALAKTNPPMLLLYVAGVVLLYLGVTVAILVAAFKEGATQGIMCLICDLYKVYFVFKESGSPVLKAWFAVTIVLGILLKFALPDN